MIYLESIPALLVLIGAAIMSPILAFVLILRNSLVYPRGIACLTAAGMAFGSLVNAMSYLFCNRGMMNNPLFLKIFTYTGGCYLIYIGYKGITEKTQNLAAESSLSHHLLKGEAFVSGFVANIIWPGPQFYFSSISTTAVLSAYAPNFAYVIYPLIIFLQTFSWYWVIAMLLSEYIKILLKKANPIELLINRITGVVVIAIALRLLFL